MKITLVHGAFDFRNDPDSGIEVIARKLAAIGHDVTTYNTNEEINPISEGYLGYSNGADSVVSTITDMSLTPKLVVLLDPVWKSLWKQFWRSPFVIPPSVKLCVTFMRRSKDFPKNSFPNRDQILFNDLGHGEIPLDSDIQDRVVQLFQGASNE